MFLPREILTMKFLEPMQNDLSRPGKDFIRDAFDFISGKYDLLNQILSLGQVSRWRNKSRDFVLDGSEKTILDLGCGTGKFLECFFREKNWERAVGLDFSSEMLKIAKKKTQNQINWVSSDFHFLPFKNKSFDLVVSAFTLRSVENIEKFLEEISNVIKKGGRVAFLSLTRPKNFLAKLLFYPYLKIYVPVMGWILTGNKRAYQFLSKSIESFQTPEETIAIMERKGFFDSRCKVFAFGAATLIIGRKTGN